MYHPTPPLCVGMFTGGRAPRGRPPDAHNRPGKGQQWHQGGDVRLVRGPGRTGTAWAGNTILQYHVRILLR